MPKYTSVLWRKGKDHKDGEGAVAPNFQQSINIHFVVFEFSKAI